MPGRLAHHLFKVCPEFFFGLVGHDFPNDIAIDFGESGGMQIVFGESSLLVQDGLAFKETRLWKGASAHKICLHQCCRPQVIMASV